MHLERMKLLKLLLVCATCAFTADAAKLKVDPLTLARGPSSTVAAARFVAAGPAAAEMADGDEEDDRYDVDDGSEIEAAGPAPAAAAAAPGPASAAPGTAFAAEGEGDNEVPDIQIVEATCEVFDCPVGYYKRNLNSTVLSKDICCQEGPDDKSAYYRYAVSGVSTYSVPSVSAMRAPRQQVPPVMNFLIMTYKGLPHKDVWERFLKRATHGVEYRVFIHCKYEHRCKRELKNNPNFTVIKSVKTEYCFGLVRAMNALLKAALLTQTSGSSLDKFIFASDTTVPVKPFSIVRQQLTSRDTSDFCFFPHPWLPWPEKPHSGLLTFLYDEFENWNSSASATRRVAMKHSQWMTLNRKDAEQAVKKDGLFPTMLDELAVNTGWPGTTSGCTDEFWHFNSLHGGTNVTGSKEGMVQLSGVTNGRFRNQARVIQGQCDTFVYWQDEDNDGAVGEVVALGRKLEADAATHFTHKVRRPCEFSNFGAKSLVMLRDSSYLFVRKVLPRANVTGSYKGEPLKSIGDAFEKLVFSEQAVKAEDLKDFISKDSQQDIKSKHEARSGPNVYQEILSDRKHASKAVQTEEVTGNLNLFVAQPGEFADNLMSQTVITKVIADLCGVPTWGVKAEITPSSSASTALTQYLRLNWGNASASFTVTLSSTATESATERSRKVQDILSKADMAKVTKQIYEALHDQDHFEGSVKAVSISRSSFNAKEELNTVAMVACHKFGLMC